MSLARTTFLLFQNRLPSRKILPLYLLFPAIIRETPLHPNLRRLIPIKKRRINLHTFYAPARYTKAEDDPVEGLRVVAPSLPAIVPGSGVGEDARFADRGCGRREVLGGCEPFVGEGQDAGSEGFGDEV